MKNHTIANILVKVAHTLIMQDIKCQIKENKLAEVYGDGFNDVSRVDNCEQVLDLLLVPSANEENRDVYTELYFDFICRNNERLELVDEENITEFIVAIIDIATIIANNDWPSQLTIDEIYKTLNLN